MYLPLFLTQRRMNRQRVSINGNWVDANRTRYEWGVPRAKLYFDNNLVGYFIEPPTDQEWKVELLPNAKLE